MPVTDQVKVKEDGGVGEDWLEVLLGIPPTET